MPVPTVRNSTWRSSNTTVTYMQRAYLGQSHAGSLVVGSVSVGSYEQWLVDSVGFLVMCLTLLSPITPSSAGFPKLCLVLGWLWVSASVSISCWVKPLWWQLHSLGSCLQVRQNIINRVRDRLPLMAWISACAVTGWPFPQFLFHIGRTNCRLRVLCLGGCPNPSIGSITWL